MAKMITRVCEICGKAFSVPLSRLRQSPARFCSMSCRSKAWSGDGNPNWKGGPETRICLQCGQPFEVIPSPSIVGKFCSTSCFNTHGHCNKGPNHGSWKSKIVEKTCPVCGELFQVQIMPCGAGDNKFCSHTCWRLGRIGSGNPAWKGGRQYAVYPREFNEELKEAIKERDDHRCQVCRKDKQLVVHHVDRNKENNSMSNLVTLCRSCHGRIHGGSLSLPDSVYQALRLSL